MEERSNQICSSVVVFCGLYVSISRMAVFECVSVLNVLNCSTHLHDLKDVTCDVHYENFRISRIRQQQQQHSPASLTR